MIEDGHSQSCFPGYENNKETDKGIGLKCCIGCFCLVGISCIFFW